MSEDKFSLRDMTRHFIENITQGNYEESARGDGILVEAKKKEPNYGDGVSTVMQEQGQATGFKRKF